MRIIKFRAWDKNDKKWIFEGTIEEISYAYDGAKLYFADTEWMQFTGLKDKNGKEIYEGDIIKVVGDYETYGMMAGEIREVYFSHGGFRLKPKDQRPHWGHWLDETEDFEVIGNIYENQELLK